MRGCLDKADVRRILVVKLRAVGDVVLATAVLPSLRKAFPAARIDFLVESAGRDAVGGNPYVDRVVVLPRKEWEALPSVVGWVKGLQFVRMLRNEGYDLVFDLFGNPRSAFLTWATGARCRVGFAFRGRKYAYHLRVVPRGDRVHEVAFNLDALRALRISVVDAFPVFYFSEKDTDYADGWISRKRLEGTFLVGIHPWGGWEAKRWGLERFAELADRIVETVGPEVVVFWGPGEEEHARRVQTLTKHRVHVAPPTSLKELAALMSRCRLVVANDSGPMHIAAAVGTPTVGIFGPTQWRLQGPYGNQHGVAYRKGLSCLGCNRLSCETNICMQALEVDEVMEVVENVVRKAYHLEVV